MGFYIRATKIHNYSVWIEKRNSRERTRVAIPRESYVSLGFDFSWDVEKAKLWAKHLNKKSQIEKKKIAAAAKRVAEDQLVNDIYLPQRFISGFDDYLKEITLGSSEWYQTLKIHWSTARKIILEIQASPEDFYDCRYKFAAALLKRRYSLDYAKRLRYIVNLWGRFYSRKTKAFFEPIPSLNVLQKEKLLEAREEKDNVRTASIPLDWMLLKNSKSKFENQGLISQWNWMYISTWFGLRPKEVDNLLLNSDKLWKIETRSKSVELWVYQTKLRSIPKPERWKVIKVEQPEQTLALKLIQSKKFKRPLVKTLVRLLEVDGIDTYSPRKGFTDLLLSRGYILEDISIFMGHRDISMTWKHYKNKKQYSERKSEVHSQNPIIGQKPN